METLTRDTILNISKDLSHGLKFDDAKEKYQCSYATLFYIRALMDICKNESQFVSLDEFKAYYRDYCNGRKKASIADEISKKRNFTFGYIVRLFGGIFNLFDVLTKRRKKLIKKERKK